MKNTPNKQFILLLRRLSPNRNNNIWFRITAAFFYPPEGAILRKRFTSSYSIDRSGQSPRVLWRTFAAGKWKFHSAHLNKAFEMKISLVPAVRSLLEVAHAGRALCHFFHLISVFGTRQRICCSQHMSGAVPAMQFNKFVYQRCNMFILLVPGAEATQTKRRARSDRQLTFIRP